MMSPDQQSAMTGFAPRRKKTRRGKGGRGKGPIDPMAVHAALGDALKSGDHATARSQAFALVRHLHAQMPQAPKPVAPEAVEGAEPSNEPPDSDDMSKNWIAGAVKNKGALHKSLGVPVGEKIPAAKVATAANSDDPLLAKRARLAQTLKSLRKK